MKRILAENDWLGSDPIFYNQRTGKFSRNVQDVIELDQLEFDPEGLNNYLDFGYCVLGRTPVKGVRFLEHSSRLLSDEHGQLSVECLEDVAVSWLSSRRSEADSIEALRERVQAWEKAQPGEIVIPTSGGYDSRLLNFLIADRSRIRSFTFGISDNQSESFEVVYARRLAEKLGARWEQIVLGEFHRLFEEWDRLFGIATHAHGMYQMEFYGKVRERIGSGPALLSGIIGDAWAGTVNPPEITRVEDVFALGLTHRIHSSSEMCLLRCDHADIAGYLAANRDRLRDPRIRVIETMRIKMMLLRYLLVVPREFGFKPWGPFLDVDLAVPMLNLPAERRAGRVWLREFFRRQGLDFESQGLHADRGNTLNFQAMRNVPVRPLDAGLLSRIMRPTYVEWINGQLSGACRPLGWLRRLSAKSGRAGAIARCLGFGDRRLEVYSAYVTLKPLEAMLKRQNRGSG